MTKIMLIDVPAMTATERSAKFRRLNPGYDARRKAIQRASEKRAVQQYIEQLRAEQAAQLAAEEARKQRGPLLLPAPVECVELQLLAAAMKQRETAVQEAAVDRNAG